MDILNTKNLHNFTQKVFVSVNLKNNLYYSIAYIFKIIFYWFLSF